MNNDNLEIMKELLENGIITQSEYDAKICQLTLFEQKSGEEIKSSTAPINYEELRKIEDLKSQGIINNDEFSQKAAQLIGLSQTTNIQANSKNTSSGWIKKNAISLVLICALIAGLIGFLVVVGKKTNEISELKTKNDSLQSQIKTKDEAYKVMQNRYAEAHKYQEEVENFYLDHAVLYVEGAGDYYHRYGCPTFPSQYSYIILNVEAAKKYGYKECPKCFNMSSGSFVDQNW